MPDTAKEIEAKLIQGLLAEAMGELPPLPQRDGDRYPARSFEEIVGTPNPVQWLVRGYIPSCAVGMIYGASNSYKTFCALDIACSIATGLAWHGFPVERAACLYVSGEGTLRNRLQAWAKIRGVEPAAPAFWAIQMPVPMDTAPAVAEIASRFEELAGRVQLPPRLIVLDTLARMLSLGGDRNPEAVHPFLHHVDWLRQKLNCGVLIVHHTGHTEERRPRGMSELPGALDYAYLLSARGDARRVEMQPFKMKEAEPPAPLSFRMRLVELPDIVDNFGRVGSSLVPELTGPEAQEEAKPVGKWQAAAYAIVRAAVESALPIEAIVQEVGKQAFASAVPRAKVRERVERALQALAQRGLVNLEGSTCRAIQQAQALFDR